MRKTNTFFLALRYAIAGVVALAGIAAAQDATEARCGSLQATDKDGKPLGACPLKHTDVKTDIAGFVARVTVTQQFQNPFSDPIEAVYTFPLSDRGAVDRMTMTIGDRVIKGVVKEREEARQIYEAARAAGKAASLLDQERPNIFTQSVANILPGNEIQIEISYVEYLKFEDGQYEFSFPMVVGPRYIPASVTDANRIAPPVTPEGTRAGHDISLSVALDAGLPIQDIAAVLHKVDIEKPETGKAVVRLQNQNEIPNRDFVLHYKVASDKIEDAVLVHHDDRGGFFTAILHPPARVAPAEATPKEMIFVIDCSGSMRGFPLEKAKSAMKQCIEGMNPKDTFNLISFAGGMGYCFPKSMPNTNENRAKALEYLRNLEGGGGTEMMPAIRAALAGPYDDTHLRIVCFMTDGFIGNDMDILDAIRANRNGARVFAFGVGNGVNRFLIEGMGREGRGASEIITLEDKGDEAAKRFHDRIQSPVLTNISVDFGGLDVREVYPDPAALPDLFSNTPVILTGRYTQPGDGTLTVRGKTVSGDFERKIGLALPADAPGQDVLAPLWARKAIDAEMAKDWAGVQSGSPNDSVKKNVTQLGIDFSLVTQFTSFVAVEEKVINENGQTRRVDVPVEMTDGVSYEGVFGDNNPAPMTLGCAAGGMVKSVAPMCMAPPSPARRGGLQSAEVGAQLNVRADKLKEAKPMPAMSPTPLEPKGEKKKDAANPKIAPELQGLEAKLVNGNYSSGDVTVKDGWVKVVIELSDLEEATLEALKQAGVKITATLHSSGKVMASVRVADLETVAALATVVKIAPAAG